MPFDDDDFDPDDFSEEDNERFEEKRKSVKNHPLLKQATEVRDTLKALIESNDNSNEEVESFATSLTGAIRVVTVKLHSALGSDSYLVCAQNAAIIRQEAEYLRLSSHLLKSIGGYDKAYISVFREEMETFRTLFIQWVKEIHQMDREGIEDEWGLFL
jgi:hypothetical protein